MKTNVKEVLVHGGMVMDHGKIFMLCAICGSVIRVNKPLLGSLHFCLTDEEIAKHNYQRPKE